MSARTHDKQRVGLQSHNKLTYADALYERSFLIIGLIGFKGAGWTTTAKILTSPKGPLHSSLSRHFRSCTLPSDGNTQSFSYLELVKKHAKGKGALLRPLNGLLQSSGSTYKEPKRPALWCAPVPEFFFEKSFPVFERPAD